ncbi:hypothetical protein D3C83_21720 [compost metagenome]
MLQAVIAQHGVAGRLRCKQRLARGDAVRTDPDRAAAAARDQDGLVAAVERIGFREHPLRRPGAAAVAAADDARHVSAGLQEFRQPQHQRRFAGAAHREVADHDYRNRQPGGGRRGAADAGDRAVQQAQGVEQRGNRGDAFPVAL